MQKYTPPLIPPRGEVNAADAFDIGSFDEEDTKGYKVKECNYLLTLYNFYKLYFKFFARVVDGKGSGTVSEFSFGYFGALAV